MLRLNFFFSLLLLIASHTIKAQDFYILDNELTTIDFHHKNQLSIGIFAPSERQKNKFALGYSPLKNYYFSGGFLEEDFMYGLNDWLQNYYNVFVKGQLYTLNVGYYQPIKLKRKKSDKPQIIYSPNFCFGFSRGRNEIFLNEWHSNFKFNKFYVQTSSNLISKYWETSLFIKVNQLSYKDGRIKTAIYYPVLMETVNVLENKSHFKTMECKFQIKGGFENIKAVGGLSFEYVLNSNPQYNFLEWGAYYLGLTIDLPQLLKKVRSK